MSSPESPTGNAPTQAIVRDIESLFRLVIVRVLDAMEHAQDEGYSLADIVISVEEEIPSFSTRQAPRSAVMRSFTRDRAIAFYERSQPRIAALIRQFVVAGQHKSWVAVITVDVDGRFMFRHVRYRPSASAFASYFKKHARAVQSLIWQAVSNGCDVTDIVPIVIAPDSPNAIEVLASIRGSFFLRDGVGLVSVAEAMKFVTCFDPMLATQRIEVRTDGRSWGILVLDHAVKVGNISVADYLSARSSLDA